MKELRRVVDVGTAVLSLRRVMAGTVARILRIGISIALLSAAVSCDRLGGGPGAEEREANYIAGQNLKMQGQVERAIGSFEQALLVNPSNASAHLALADLFFDQLEFINAAYHYSRHQKLRERRGQKPDASVASRLEACELKLALQYSQKLGRQQTDTEIEALRRQIAEKDSTIQRLQNEILQHSSSTNAPSGDPTPRTKPVVESSAGSDSRTAVTTKPRSPEPTRPTTPEKSRTPAATSSSSTHIVKAGETPATIARKHGISVKALMAANPSLNPNRMQVGTALKIPAQ